MRRSPPCHDFIRQSAHEIRFSQFYRRDKQEDLKYHISIVIKNFPEILEQYRVDAFWDSPLDSIDPVRNRNFVIERLLDYGGMDAIKWLFEYYGPETLKDVIRTSRRLSRSTASFWGTYFSVPREQIRCLSEPMLFQIR